MKILKKTATIRGEKFEVAELMASDLAPLWASTDTEAVMTIDDFFKMSVRVKGKPIGEDSTKLPAAVYMKLLPLVREVNAGLLGGDEGND